MARLPSFIALLLIVSVPSNSQACVSVNTSNGNMIPATKNPSEIHGDQEMIILFEKSYPMLSNSLDEDKLKKSIFSQVNHRIADHDSLNLVDYISTKIINDALQTDGWSGETNVLGMWNRSGQQLKLGVSTLLRPWILRLFEISTEADLSPECSTSLEYFMVDLMKTNTYAMKVLDSWAKIRPGIFQFTTNSLVNYDECLSIDVQNLRNRETRYFKGQYCVIDYLGTSPRQKRLLTAYNRIFNFTGTPLQGKSLETLLQHIGFQHGRPNRLGICVPSLCSRDDIQSLIDEVSKTNDEYQIKVNRCEIMEPPKWADYQILILVVFGIQIVIVGIGTLVDSITNDIRLQKMDNKIPGLKKFILCFSLRINCRDLFRTTPIKDDVGAFHGIRVISMMWIIYGHTYFMIEYIFTDNRQELIRDIRTFSMQVITSAWLLVDTLFFMTGFLHSVSFFKKFRNSEIRFNILQTLFNRIYRLLGPLIFVVLFTFVWVNLAHGPIWHEVVGSQVEICKRTWWATIFFFNNFLKVEDKCHEFSWYVGADIHLFTFIFIPAFLAALKWPRATVPLFVSIVTLGAIIPAIVINHTGFPPMPLYTYVSKESFWDIVNTVHFTSWFHIVPYSLGMITGYAFHKKSRASIPAVLRLMALALSGLLYFSAFLWIPQLWSNNQLNDIWWFTLFGASQKLLLSLSLMVIFYMCATNNGGLVNEILSCRTFLPVSRLCYSLYLTHLLVMRTRMGIAEDTGFYNNYNMFCEFLLNVVFSFILAIPFYLMCEAPLASLHNKYLGKIFVRRNLNTKGEDCPFLNDK